MITQGTYSETLSSGGELKVSSKGWRIYYYFPGPDGRYNGTSVSIEESKVEEYIQAFIENYNEWEKLKEVVPEGGSFEKVGKANMTIRVGKSYWEGICLCSYHMQIKDKEKLNQVIESYKYAIERAKEITEKLYS
jgi:PDZ domain-containing secreted protein